MRGPSRCRSGQRQARFVAWWKVQAKVRLEARSFDGTGATSSPCRRATGSFTRAAAARLACFRFPTAISTGAWGFSEKRTEILRLKVGVGSGTIVKEGEVILRSHVA